MTSPGAGQWGNIALFWFPIGHVMCALRLAVILLAANLAAGEALAAADRDGLLEAWENHMRSLPGTAEFVAEGEGSYRLRDTELPYDGSLRVVSSLVRSADNAGFETGFSHMGIVEFVLDDMPPERLASQAYYYWIADRQHLHYYEPDARWVDTQAYQQVLTGLYGGEGAFAPLSFMLNYGIWILLIALLVFAFGALKRQSTKARSLMDETRDINAQARRNLDRSEKMQDEVLAIAREARDLQQQNNELLRQLVELNRR